jgi:hypothetical protein
MKFQVHSCFSHIFTVLIRIYTALSRQATIVKRCTTERQALARSFTVYCVATRNGTELYGPPLFSTDKSSVMYFFKGINTTLLLKQTYLREHSLIIANCILIWLRMRRQWSRCLMTLIEVKINQYIVLQFISNRITFNVTYFT